MPWEILHRAAPCRNVPVTFTLASKVPSSDADWDAVHKSNYEAAAFWNVRWIATARDLYESARQLEPAIEAVWGSYRGYSVDETPAVKPDHFSGAYFMLVSFAVENLLKAAAVSRNAPQYKEYFRRTGEFPPILKKHDLMKLAAMLHLTIAPEEEDLLRRLTRSATWYGRYPAPLKYSDMSGVERFSDGKEYRVSWLGRDDVKRLSKLIDSLPIRLGLPEGPWKNAG